MGQCDVRSRSRFSPCRTQPNGAAMSLDGRPREVKPMGGRRLSPAILMIMPKPDNDASPLSDGREGQFRSFRVFHLPPLIDRPPAPLRQAMSLPSQIARRYRLMELQAAFRKSCFSRRPEKRLELMVFEARYKTIFARSPRTKAGSLPTFSLSMTCRSPVTRNHGLMAAL